MKKAVDRIENLIREGEKFTYDNFSLKNYSGYPVCYKPGWVKWVRRVHAVQSPFREGASIDRLVKSGDGADPLGNGKDKFQICLSFYLSALRTAVDVLQSDIFGEVVDDKAHGPAHLTNKVFVVHGHDEKAKDELSILLSELGLEPIVLHRQPDGGQTIVEKFDEFAEVGYAFILMTPDEIAYVVDQEILEDSERHKENRALSNVIFEFRYFVGKLGRNRTCCLHRGDVIPPIDLSGLIYKKFDVSVEEVRYAIIEELKAAGYKLA